MVTNRTTPEATPSRIGRYRVREVIGIGGFATVYRATDERLGTDVAIKVLAENHSLDPDVRTRFVEEGRRLRRVHGPHLLAVHDIGETERAQPYLVLDLADRGDLATRVGVARTQGRPPGPDDILAVGRAVERALGVLHRNHLVHRDLAPKNLLLRSTSAPADGAPWPDPRALGSGQPTTQPLVAADEQLVLADLGVSKDLAVASGLTVATGTSGFAPPEQRAHGTVDSRADIWAASALIVWLATHRPPDDAGAWRQDLQNAGWSPEVTRMLTRGLAHQPQDRYQTIEEWSAALEAALHAALLPSTAWFPSGSSEPRSRRPEPRPRRMKLTLAVLATLIVGIGVAGAGVAVIRDPGGPTVHTEQLVNGNERTVVEAQGITISVDGPTTATVGETISFTASVDGAESWAWVAPGGVLIDDTSELELDARSTGGATLHVIAFDQQNHVVRSSRQLNVTDDGEP